MHSIYLDHAAATPLDPAVVAAMAPYWSEQFYNPSALYSSAVTVRKSVQEARKQIAGLLGVQPGEIIFTAGGSEANNLAIFGVAKITNGSIVTTMFEHDSVWEPMNNLVKTGTDVTFVKPEKSGVVKAGAVLEAINDTTTLVSIMYVNNEIGTIQPIKEIGQGIHKIRQERTARGVQTPLYFHTDGCQATNYLSMEPHRLGVDLMTINASKIYGPKQVGLLYVRAGLALSPLIYGGGQERALRSGTENVAGIIGFAKALELVGIHKKDETRRLTRIQEYSAHKLLSVLPDIQIFGLSVARSPNYFMIIVPGADNERLLYQLDEMGISVAIGSACSAAKGQKNRTLETVGMKDEHMSSSLRITMGRQTRQEDMDVLVNCLKALVLKR